jgi:glycerol uptake facilitator protein
MSLSAKFAAEIIGTMLLIILGDGVVANVLLKQSKGQGGGWIVITAGWGFAVAVAVYSVGWISGGHLNPAVTIALATIGHGEFPWANVPAYIAAQMIGAFLGAVVVWLAYLPHWGITEDKAAVRGVFCTAPAIRKPMANLITEIIGTFVLVVGVLAIPSVNNLDPKTGFSTGLGPLLVGFLVWSIGLSLGGPTGYAINPARDLGPRLAHAVLPIRGKADSDWSYAWVPIIGPIIGGVAGALFHKFCWPA